MRCGLCLKETYSDVIRNTKDKKGEFPTPDRRLT